MEFFVVVFFFNVSDKGKEIGKFIEATFQELKIYVGKCHIIILF